MQVPHEFLSLKGRDFNSSPCSFTKHTTLLFFVPRKGEDTLLLSSVHHNAANDSHIEKAETLGH
jgi:hypothetical protein